MQAKRIHWTLTYSPEGDTDGCPDNIKEFIKEHATRFHLVQEKASKLHVQCYFITKTPYSRSWGNAKRMSLGYNKVELKIHPHPDPLGALGYQEGDVLETTFSKKEIEDAKQYYGKMLWGKKYRDNIKTAKQIGYNEIDAVLADVMDDNNVDVATAKKMLAEANYVWKGMPTQYYVDICRARETLGDPKNPKDPKTSLASLQ